MSRTSASLHIWASMLSSSLYSFDIFLFILCPAISGFLNLSFLTSTNKYTFTYSFNHSLTHSNTFIHSRIHPLTLSHSFTQSFDPTLTHSNTRSFTHMIILSLNHLLWHSLTHSLTLTIWHHDPEWKQDRNTSQKLKKLTHSHISISRRCTNMPKKCRVKTNCVF